MKRWISVLALAFLMGGCMYMPRTTTSYDDKCQIERRHMSLEVHQVAAIAGCSNEACVGLLVLFGVVTSASAVVSESVVLVGNVVYWLEEQGVCLNRGKADPREND